MQKGDTVSGIAARQGVSISALIQLNNLRAPYTLQIGQALVLPTSVDAPGSFAGAPPAVAMSTGPQPKPFVPQGSTNVLTQAGTATPNPQPGGVSAGNLPPSTLREPEAEDPTRRREVPTFFARTELVPRAPRRPGSH